MNLSEYLKQRQKLINKYLARLIPGAGHFPPAIHRAMRYGLAGGKRIRPILCLASCELCGGAGKSALLSACAIEMVHTYSLIHDDLPCMDDDDFRRGRPSVHKKFNEAIAVLTGDALQTLAYNILAQADEEAAINNMIIKELSQAVGTDGMIGGQVVDTENQKGKTKKEKLSLDLPIMEYIATHKTGALIAASCKIGAIIAKASKREQDAMHKYGEYIGFVFQITDDMLDNDGLVKIYGKKDAFGRAKELTEKAKAQLSIFGKNKEPLLKIADFILNRKK